MTPIRAGIHGLLVAAMLAQPAAARADGTIAPENEAAPGMPVMVGGSDGFDACFGVGVVGMAPDHGSREIMVSAEPAHRRPAIDRLAAGQRVYLCDDREAWTGVVYRPDGDLTACGVSGPQQARRPYDGPCRSGWVRTACLIPAAG